MHALQAIGLGKSYNNDTALTDLNLSISQGEIFCLLGQNGAGKTTTINLFLGFTKPSAGKALINGLEVRHDDNTSKKFTAYIPEVVQLYSNLTGVENLDFFSRLAGFTYNYNWLGGLLTNAGLPKEAHDKRLSTYSKGMRQKVAIAIALAKNADVILMDEPTSGLDPKATAEFTGICKGLADKGKTIFMATHDIFHAVNVGTRIGIMNKGRLKHVVEAGDIDASRLQALYLETV